MDPKLWFHQRGICDLGLEGSLCFSFFAVTNNLLSLAKVHTRHSKWAGAQMPPFTAAESPLWSVVIPVSTQSSIIFLQRSTTVVGLMQSNCDPWTNSPSRIPRMRGAPNSSARKYSQSQERDRTRSLGDQPSLPKNRDGALPVPPARRVPPERGLLSRSAHASGEAAPPRTPSRKWPSRGLDFSGGAARPVTPFRASSRMFTVSHGTYHRHYSDKH